MPCPYVVHGVGVGGSGGFVGGGSGVLVGGGSVGGGTGVLVGGTGVFVGGTGVFAAGAGPGPRSDRVVGVGNEGGAGTSHWSASA